MEPSELKVVESLWWRVISLEFGDRPRDIDK